MAIVEQIQRDAVSALKAGEKDRVAALRMIVAALQRDAKEGANDEVAVLQRERKRRIESAAVYREGGRDDRAEAELAEAELIVGYMPRQLSDADLGEIVATVIVETGADSQKDMGRVIGAVMSRVKGGADGARVSALVRERIAS